MLIFSRWCNFNLKVIGFYIDIDITNFCNYQEPDGPREVYKGAFRRDNGRIQSDPGREEERTKCTAVRCSCTIPGDGGYVDQMNEVSYISCKQSMILSRGVERSRKKLRGIEERKGNL